MIGQNMTHFWVNTCSKRPSRFKTDSMKVTEYSMYAQALAELSEAGLSEGKVEMLWDLYTEARQAQEDRSGGGGGASAGVAPGQPARPTQGVEGAGRVGMFALGMLSRLLTVLRLMYAVSLLVASASCLL